MVMVQTDAFKSLEVINKDGDILRIDEGMNIKFSTETGELIKGKLNKICKKGEKTELEIIPHGESKKEIWQVAVMAEGSLDIDE
ncbi:hypothetical protein KQI61_06015 [Anaerocolumna aminovalerica]|uniref:hypothetical protein n=1 Tax=Anaerocolumna aminovalerica TaxID=1527 RepID=UPI001C0EB90A|nr:hypothetical protein [Anaerocolumna aminovalerica]MBU5331746.1 hypothetical protein [Anaerocolumna aminovalerica]